MNEQRTDDEPNDLYLLPALSEGTFQSLFHDVQSDTDSIQDFGMQSAPEMSAPFEIVNRDVSLAIPLVQDSYLCIPTTSHSSYTGLQTMPPNQIQQVPQDQTPVYDPNIVPISNSMVPANNVHFNGPYGFSVAFHPQEKSTKNATWTYSEMREKLFVSMGVNCPIDFHTSILPPIGTVIVVSTAYIMPSHSLTPVLRCLNHQKPTESYNLDHPALDHVVRCSSHDGIYSTDERTGHKMLTLPYRSQDEMICTYLYQFMCWSSCAGGMNRRRIKVIFSLQSKDACLGQQSFEVRVCACPGRDRKAEEKHFLRLEGEYKNGKSATDNEPCLITDLKRALPSFKTFSANPPPAKKKKAEKATKSLTMQCESLAEYEFLTQVRTAYRAAQRRCVKKESSGEETAETD